MFVGIRYNMHLHVGFGFISGIDISLHGINLVDGLHFFVFEGNIYHNHCTLAFYIIYSIYIIVLKLKWIDIWIL